MEPDIYMSKPTFTSAVYVGYCSQVSAELTLHYFAVTITIKQHNMYSYVNSIQISFIGMRKHTFILPSSSLGFSQNAFKGISSVSVGLDVNPWFVVLIGRLCSSL